MKYKYLVLTTAAVLFLSFIAALLTLQEHVVFYQEQHQLFLYTRAYVGHMLSSEGLPALAGAFMVQFYHIPWLGAGIVAAMLSGIYLGIEYLIYRLTGLHDYLQSGALASICLYFTLDGIDETPGIVALTFIGVAFLCMIAAAAGRYLPKKRVGPISNRVGMTLMVVLLIVYIAAGRYFETKDYNRAERAMILAEKAAKEQDWTKCRALTEAYLSTGRENRLMQYLRCVSLANQGELLEHIFDYPMKGGTAELIFPWNGDSRESEYGHLAHETIGDLNAAHHWAFEAMTVWGETAPHLLNLARYNIALGRPEVARKFTSLLSKSLFYRGEAERLNRQIEGKEPSDLHYAYRNVPDSVAKGDGLGFINVKYPAADLIAITRNDSTNRKAKDYLLALLMLANDQNALMEHIDRESMKIHTVQEAMLIFSMYPLEPDLENYGLTLSKETEDRYGKYRDLFRRNQMGELERNFGNTFWEYINNHCPYGVPKRATVATTVKSPETES